MTTFPGHRRALLIGAITVLVFVVAVPFFRWTKVSPRSTLLVGVPERGAKLFYGKKQCAICHSVNGSGGRLAPDLGGSQPESPAMGWLTTKLWNHGPGMWRQIRRQSATLPDVTEQEMADILSFLYQASTLDPPGNIALGRQVFTEKGCIQCHSVGKVGGSAAPELSRIAISGDRTEWARAMLNHAGLMIDPITRTLGKWPQFRSSEMNDLIAYVTSVSRVVQKNDITGDADLGMKVFQSRCMQCHSIRSTGGKLAPELGPERNLPLSTAGFASLMWNHAPAMLQKGRENNVAAPNLQANEMSDLLAFLASIRYFEPSGSPDAGRRVFSLRGCASCHGLSAEGTATGPRLKAVNEVYTLPSFTAALWRHGPRMFERVEEKGMPWPELRSGDIGDLVSFLNQREDSK